jgi:acyl-CoA synthetase (AMP-forming)/AMP-acid ligase II
VLFIAGEPTPVETIIAHCRTKLPAALVPRKIHFLASWPLNANGKTDYGALQQRLTGNHDNA